MLNLVTQQAGSAMTSTIMFVAIILIFYFLIMRPQSKRDKEVKNMLATLKKGDKVVTIGGIHGTIISVKEDTVVLKVDDNARIEFQKNAVSAVLNKEAAKPAPKKDKAEKAAVAEPKKEEAAVEKKEEK